MDNNVNFTGFLYGRMGNHLTKGILCCPHGDAKFIRTVNRLVLENPDSVKILFEPRAHFTKNLVIETKELPKVNLFEYIFYRIESSQRKALKMRKEGKIDSFVYKINEFEYNHLKKAYSFISKKTFKTFEDNIRKIATLDEANYLKEFFY